MKKSVKKLFAFIAVVIMMASFPVNADTSPSVSVDGKVTGSVQEVVVDSNLMAEAVYNAKTYASSIISSSKAILVAVTFDITDAEGVNKIKVSLPAADMVNAQKDGADKFVINTSLGTVDFKATSILAEGQTATTVDFIIEKVEKPANAPANAIAIDFKVLVDGNDVSDLNAALTLSIPYQLSSGEDKTNIVIYGETKNGSNLTLPGVYNALKGMVEFKTTNSGKFYSSQAKLVTFSDVKPDFWGYSYITNLASKGIVQGNNGAFSPNKNITRAEFVAIITRSLKLTAPKGTTPFTDVSATAWYAENVAAAYDAGLIKGKSETIFDPNAPITRQEAAVVIANTLKYIGYKPETDSSKANVFSDVNLIADWAKASVATAYSKGVISGSNGKFNPLGNATRAEVAKMLYQVYFLQ